MKERLLKPPAGDEELLFIPELRKILSLINARNNPVIGLCHQPYFFHPGVSVKFLFLNFLKNVHKRIIFLDTDRLTLITKVPNKEKGKVQDKSISFINTNEILLNFPTPSKEKWQVFFREMENCLLSVRDILDESILNNFREFSQILFENISYCDFLKDALAKTFLEFSGIDESFLFLSDLLDSEEFKDFFMKIYHNHREFRKVFNAVLREFKETFKFRFKSYPYPVLEENELPFWILEGVSRRRCFYEDVEKVDIEKLVIMPRASTLTLFLRLYVVDVFIHGVGGANYEWVQDRVIEKFFKVVPPKYIVVSGTFLLNSKEGLKLADRESPYFLFTPYYLKNHIASGMQTVDSRKGEG